MPVRLEVVPKSEIFEKALPRDSAPTRPYILVVDDETLIADTLVLILRQNGYAADAAYNAFSALEAIHVIPPDLLISDVAMPGMSGVDLAIAVRKSVPDCKVLLFSGHASTSDLLKDAEQQGYTFTLLTKPVHPSDLLARAGNLFAMPQTSNPEAQQVSSH